MQIAAAGQAARIADSGGGARTGCFVSTCARCHNAYDTQALHGPSLFGVFRKPYLPSGAPARDERVMEVVLHGRNLMPPSGGDLTDQQLQELLRYLHTL